MTETSTNFNTFVGRQIAAARKSAKLTQDELSNKLGFKDRQILSNIEKGLRKVKPSELEIIMALLNKPFEYFSDPYQLPDNQLFSWRANTADAVKESEPKAKGAVTVYRRFADLTNKGLTPIIPRLALNPSSSFEDVLAIAEQLVSFLKIGDLPGYARAEAACEQLNIEIFYLDIPDDASGASLLLDDFCALFINRKHPAARRNFSLAHELFHVLTWDTFRPEHFSPEDQGQTRKRSEQLANNFASAMILPKNEILELWKPFDDGDLKAWLETTALDLKVSPPALFWRLVNLGELKRDDYPKDLETPYSDNAQPPAAYSKRLADMMLQVFKQGDVSVRKTAKTLGCTFEYLEDVFSSHNLEAPFEL